MMCKTWIYWMPAFAGMTIAMTLTSCSSASGPHEYLVHQQKVYLSSPRMKPLRIPADLSSTHVGDEYIIPGGS